MEDIPLTYDEAVTLPANKFSRENYVFGGWSLTKAGEVRYTDSESVKNISKLEGSTMTLYAVWIPEEYKISYENLYDGVSTNAASYNIESETIILRAAVRTGYVFEGWYDNAGLTGDKVDRIEHGSIGNRTFYADWSPAKDTRYRVEHYLQQLDGSYVLDRTDELTGVTEDIVTPQTHDYAGFTAPEQRTLEITADGNAVLRYDYTRNTYTLTFDATEGTLEGNDTITALYGADITPPSAYREGYGFAGWYDGDVRFDVRTMPSKDMKLTAAWKAGEYGYTVNYYHQNVDGSDQYTLAASLNETAPMVSYVHIPFVCITYEMIETCTQAVYIYIIHISEMRLTFCFYSVNILCCIIHISFKHIAFRQICIDHCQSADIALILRSRHVSCVCAQKILSGFLIHSGVKIQIPNINFNTTLNITYVMLITAPQSQHIIFQCRDRITLRYRYYRHKIICPCLQPPLLRAFQISESIDHHIKHIIKIILYIICCT